MLRLGTEVIASQDGTVSALLGASPGASTAAPIMLNLLQKVFKDKFATPEWQTKIKELVPSYGQKLNGNISATEHELAETSRILQLDYTPMTPAAANDEPTQTADVVGK